MNNLLLEKDTYEELKNDPTASYQRKNNELIKRIPEVKTISLSAEIDDIRTTTDLPGICSLCGDSDDHVQLLLVHLREGHQLKQGLFVCPFCDYTSIKYEVVMKHTTKVHKLVSEQHKCDQCDYKTYRGDLYNRHLNEHLKEKIYSCDHCHYKTINVINFKRHLSSKHTKETENKCQLRHFTSINLESVIEDYGMEVLVMEVAESDPEDAIRYGGRNKKGRNANEEVTIDENISAAEEEDAEEKGMAKKL
ncbi:hypothetical protein WA026_012795 [Henosepilachna vigintioctopunctata]|uniref:C2H2-type domain-containing protein n=1 Tax=Henosepilachna vigintioctopunctata TaxID=420089 RepID=A0AAW1U7A5_9CUCU